MTFDFDEIEKIACGIERTNVNEEGALELLRFTDAEAEYYGWRTDGKPTASAASASNLKPTPRHFRLPAIYTRDRQENSLLLTCLRTINFLNLRE